MSRRDPKLNPHLGYHRRVLFCLVSALAVMIAAFRFWPIPDPEDVSAMTFHVMGQEVAIMEEIEQTRQQKRKPPPPAPMLPVPVPDDVILPDEIIDFEPTAPPAEDFTLDAPEGPPAEGEEGIPSFVARAEQAPKPIRFVEPEYTSEARKQKIRAQVVVEVLVNQEGRVEETRITDLFLLSANPDEAPNPVEALGYGLEEAAISAAQRWRFRPARHKGQTVSSYATLTFSFGT